MSEVNGSLWKDRAAVECDGWTGGSHRSAIGDTGGELWTRHQGGLRSGHLKGDRTA